jgi:hypothetical protein
MMVMGLVTNLLLLGIGTDYVRAETSILPTDLPGLKNFGPVTERIFRGAAPNSEGLQTLKDELKIDTVIDLTSELEDLIKPLVNEKKTVEDLGMKYIPIPWDPRLGMTAKQLTETEEMQIQQGLDKQVEEAFKAMTNPENGRVFIHCLNGKHRTGVIIAIYRIEADKWPLEKVVKEMEDFGFNDEVDRGWLEIFLPSDETHKEAWKGRLEGTVLRWYRKGFSEPRIISNLEILESPPYSVGQEITARFTIKNEKAVWVVFDVLTVGGRLDGNVKDFEWKTDIQLPPGGVYNYEGTLKLEASGNYHFFTAYRTKDGQWNTAIPTAEGATNTKDISVQPVKPPKVDLKWIVKERSTSGIASGGFVSDDGVLYTVVSSIAGDYLHAIEIATGKIIRSRPLSMMREERLLGISKKAVYLFREEKPYSLVALDRLTFQVLWDKDCRDLGIGYFDGLFCWWGMSEYGPLYSLGLPYRNSPLWLIDESRGEVLWERQPAPEESKRGWRIAALGRTVALLLIFEPSQVNYVSIDLSNGKSLWERQFRDSLGQHLIGQNLLLVLETEKEQVSRIRLMDMNTGDIKWENKKEAELHFVDANEQVLLFFSPLKEYMIWHGLSPINGRTLWEKRTETGDVMYFSVGGRVSSPSGVGLVNGFLAISRNGNLYLVDALTGKIVGEYQEFFPFFTQRTTAERVREQLLTYYQDMLIVSSGEGLKAYLVTK